MNFLCVYCEMQVAHIEFSYSAEFALNASFRAQGAVMWLRTGKSPCILSTYMTEIVTKKENENKNAERCKLSMDQTTKISFFFLFMLS